MTIDQAALEFLRRDVLGNLPMLKMLATYEPEAKLLHREGERPAAMLLRPIRRRSIRRVGAYVSYTWPPERATTADPRVRVSLTTEPIGRKLRAAMPKTLEDVLPYFERGDARLFTIGENGAPIAGCLAFPIFEHVHEIGVLYTAPGFRHRGHARALVATAAHDLRGRGLVARYQTAEDNAASRAVAEVAGFVPFLTLEHWTSDRTA